MITTVCVQVKMASTPTLKAVEKAFGLWSRAEATTDAGEREVCVRELERISAEWRLAVGAIRAYAPPGSRPGTDDGIVTAAGMPWWRSGLAIASSLYAGFQARRPWRPEVEDGADDFVAVHFGTREALDTLHATYAGATAVCIAAFSHAPEGARDEFMMGVSMVVMQHLVAAANQRAVAPEPDVPHGAECWWCEHKASIPMRRALIPRPEESDAVDLAKALKDQESALNKGKQLAARLQLGPKALEKRPKMSPQDFATMYWNGRQVPTGTVNISPWPVFHGNPFERRR